MASWFDKTALIATAAANADKLMAADTDALPGTRDRTINMLELRKMMIGSSLNLPKSASYTVAAADLGATIEVDTSSAAMTVTLPVSIGNFFQCWIVNIGANTLTIAGDGTSTVAGVTSLGQWEAAWVHADALDNFRSAFMGATAPITDHGALTGLADDDHAQYHTDARALAWLNARSVGTLSDVDTTTVPPNLGEALRWDGTNWVPKAAFDARDAWLFA